MPYRYYSTLRPISIGCYPKSEGNMVLEINNFNSRVPVKEINRAAWGWIEFEKPLSERDAFQYDLVPFPAT